MQTINITLGTAGHIDHGKTALVRNLTGCETDRLKEEQQRGMSIELGFAPCLVAGLQVGIVDVPGHEDFIKTMVAGAACIDGVILVVAADDGVMPQTREHLDILTLLGVRHGVVALTKADRVPPEQLDTASAQVRQLLRGTFLEDAAIMPLSNVTGQGFDSFQEELRRLVERIPSRPVNGVFRLPVERVFSVKGYGTVVTGIPLTGRAAIGDELTLLPAGRRTRLKAIQVFKHTAAEVQAGQCSALNLAGVAPEDVARGHTLAAPDFFTPRQWFLVRLRLLPQDRLFLKNAQRVKFHTGTSEATAAVYLLEADRLLPGPEALAQVRTETPLIAAPRDRFIIRALTPPHTIGGGVVVEALERRGKRHPEALALAHTLAQSLADDHDLVSAALLTMPEPLAPARAVALRVKLPGERVDAILGALATAGQIRQPVPGLFLHPAALQTWRARLTGILAAFHQQQPRSPGALLEDLLRETDLSKPALEQLLTFLQKEKLIEIRAGRYALATYQPAIPPGLQADLSRLEELFRQNLFAPPSPDEAAAALCLPPARIRELLTLLQEHQKLVRVEGDLFFHAAALAEARRRLEEHLRREGRLESVKFKYLLDTTRKYALPLLDYFDRVGLTRRTGYTRFLK